MESSSDISLQLPLELTACESSQRSCNICKSSTCKCNSSSTSSKSTSSKGKCSCSSACNSSTCSSGTCNSSTSGTCSSSTCSSSTCSSSTCSTSKSSCTSSSSSSSRCDRKCNHKTKKVCDISACHIESNDIRTHAIESHCIKADRIILDGNILDVRSLAFGTTISSAFAAAPNGLGSVSGSPSQQIITLPTPSSIPQGVFNGTITNPVFRRLPNFLSIISFESPVLIGNLLFTTHVQSKVIIQNVGTVALNVAYTLFLYSRNCSVDQNILLDISVQTIIPNGGYATFNVEWVPSNTAGVLPLLAGTSLAAFNTAVQLVNSTCSSAATCSPFPAGFPLVGNPVFNTCSSSNGGCGTFGINTNNSNNCSSFGTLNNNACQNQGLGVCSGLTSPPAGIQNLRAIVSPREPPFLGAINITQANRSTGCPRGNSIINRDTNLTVINGCPCFVSSTR